MHVRRRDLVAIGAAACLLAGCSSGTNGTAAGACAAPAITLSGSGTEATVRVGDVLTLEGTGHQPCQDQGEGLPTTAETGIAIDMVGTPTVTLARVDAAPLSGDWTATVTIPEIPPGSYEIRTDSQSPGDGVALTVEP